jgi:hypothetical protein
MAQGSEVVGVVSYIAGEPMLTHSLQAGFRCRSRLRLHSCTFRPIVWLSFLNLLLHILTRWWLLVGLLCHWWKPNQEYSKTGEYQETK